jgi:hypothetical protein
VGSFFNSKPTDAHVIWRSGRDSDGKKKFDFEYLRLWAAHFGVEYKQWERVDHERADEPRTQHVCVFRRATTDENELSLDGESWSMGTVKKPRTFVEIDEAGVIRLRSWSHKNIYDAEEFFIDSTVFKLKTANGEKKAIDTRKLANRPGRA